MFSLVPNICRCWSLAQRHQQPQRYYFVFDVKLAPIKELRYIVALVAMIHLLEFIIFNYKTTAI